MATPRFAWGIDIGNRALKAVKLVSTGEGLKVDDFDVIEHETVLSSAGDNRDSLIQSALANFVQRHPGVEKGQVGVGVSGQQSFARFIKLPPVEPSKIPEIVRFEAIQQIPFPLDDVEWSYQLFQEAESPDIEVGIFAMRKELINQHIKFFTDDDLNVQVVQMNPLAVYNAMYYDSRIKGTTMIVDLGAENTDLVIADGETVWLRSIPIGGNNFTEALTKGFKVNFTKAEDLKRNASTSKYGRQIMQAMRPMFAELVAEIQRSIGFYSSVHRESRISKVIALGSTFRLPGLQKYLQQNLQMDVERIDSLGAGMPSDPKLAATFSENLLSMPTAYGLALQVMNQGKIVSSLLPEKIRREKMWQQKTKWFAAAAALFVVGAAVPYGSYYFYNWQLDQSAPQASEVQGILGKAKGLDSQWSTIEQAGGTDRTRIANVKSLEEYRNLWTHLLEDVYSILPQFAPGAPPELTSTDIAAIKKISRTDRKLVLVDTLGSRYVPDLTTVLADPQFARYAELSTSIAAAAAPVQSFNPDMGDPGMQGMPPEMGGMGGPGDMAMGGMAIPGALPTPTGPAAANAQRGFLITIKCTTPYGRGVQLIDQSVIKQLMALAPATKNYKVVKAVIVSAVKVRNDPAKLQALNSAYQIRLQREAAAAAAAAAATVQPGGPLGVGMAPPPAPMMPNLAGGFGSAPGNGVNNPAVTLDPILNEDVSEDTTCTVLFAVVLDPPPAPAETKTVAMQ